MANVQPVFLCLQNPTITKKQSYQAHLVIKTNLEPKPSIDRWSKRLRINPHKIPSMTDAYLSPIPVYALRRDRPVTAILVRILLLDLLILDAYLRAWNTARCFLYERSRAVESLRLDLLIHHFKGRFNFTLYLVYALRKKWPWWPFS